MGTSPRPLLAASAFVWLSGCAVGPAYKPPVVAVPATFVSGPLAPEVANNPPAPEFVRWWQVLRDPQLDRLIEQAVARNPDIELALLRVQEARSQQIVVQGAMMPNAAGTATIADGTGIDLPRSRVELPLLAGDDPRGARQIDRIGGFVAGWEIDLFGKLQRALAAARNDAEAKAELRRAVLIAVIADVAQAYFRIRILQIRFEIASRDVATARRALDLAAAKLEGGSSGEPEQTQDGKSSGQSSQETNRPAQNLSKEGKSARSKEMSLALAKAGLAIQQARLPSLAAALSDAESQLALLLGANARDIGWILQGPVKLPPLPEHLRPGIPVELLRRRPDIRAGEREIAAATERIGVATANLFPTVELLAGLGVQGTRGQTPDPALQLHGPIWSFGPRAYWPVLDFGRLDALINIEEMHTREALVSYKKAIVAAIEEVDLAITHYSLERRRWKALAVAQGELRRAAGTAMERYRRGEIELPILLDVLRRNYAHSEQATLAVEAAVLRYIAFYKALGGGWELYDELPPLPPARPAVIASIRRMSENWR